MLYGTDGQPGVNIALVAWLRTAFTATPIFALRMSRTTYPIRSPKVAIQETTRTYSYADASAWQNITKNGPADPRPSEEQCCRRSTGAPQQTSDGDRFSQPGATGPTHCLLNMNPHSRITLHGSAPCPNGDVLFVHCMSCWAQPASPRCHESLITNRISKPMSQEKRNRTSITTDDTKVVGQ